MHLHAMIVVIPSYERAGLIQTRTLALCRRLGILDRVVVFIANEPKQIADYTAALPGIRIETGPRGLCAMRNHITTYFPEGTELFCMDDDIEELYCAEGPEGPPGGLRLITPDEFHEWIDNAFAELRNYRASLFGVYPVKNAFFMKDLPPITRDLRFCVGSMWGCINRHDIILTLEEKEDFERTLLAYQRDGAVIRYNRIAPKTRYYKTPGGLQANARDRVADAKESCRILMERFPQWCKLYMSKKNGMPEIRLRG